jgi:hypothetical protein
LRLVTFAFGGTAAENRVPQAGVAEVAPLTQVEMMFARVLIFAVSGVARRATD